MGLFKPGWMAADYKRALTALNKIADEATLRDAALKAPVRDIRETAVKRLCDYRRIIEVILAPGLNVPQKAAIKRLMAVEPLCRVWDGLEKMDKEAITCDEKLQSCLAVIARYAEGYGIRRKAAKFLTDQTTLKHLGMNDWDEDVRRIALERIDDQQYLQVVFDAGKSDGIRLSAIANMRDTGRAAILARTAQTPSACVGALKKASDPAVAQQIMGETLVEYVLDECAKRVSPEEITDDWRLAVLALCGSTEARAKALRRINDFAVFERIAMHDGQERFPSMFESMFLCRKAVGHIAADAALLRVFCGAKERCVREEALRKIGDAGELLVLLEENPLRYCGSKLLARLDEIDKEWPAKAGRRAVEGMAQILQENMKNERFDYEHIAQALKRIYAAGRTTGYIARLQGIAVSHDDASGAKNRGNGCHMDSGYTYLDLTGIEPKIKPEIFWIRNNHDEDEALQNLNMVDNQETLKAIALDNRVSYRVRAEAVCRITDEYILFSVALEIEQLKNQHIGLDVIQDPQALLMIARDAKALKVRKEALRRITDAKALFDIVSADVPESFRPEICERLNALDADWARQLSDAAVRTLTAVIEGNKKDEQFDYRHYAAALKSVYRQGRSRETIKKLDGKAVAHLDYTGKEYRDKWCHQDGDYEYFDLRDTVLAGVADPEKLKTIARDKTVPDTVRAEAAQRTDDGDALLSVALEAEAGSDILNRIKDPDQWLELVRGAESPKVRQWAVQQVTDTDALLAILGSDILRYCTPEICARLDALDADWARRLDDAAITQMISVIAENEKDERFDYRPMAGVLKRVYTAGRFSGAIEGLNEKAVSHADVQGKAYRDEWCHTDYGFTYFNLTNEV